jgi:hypothetical protein
MRLTFEATGNLLPLRVKEDEHHGARCPPSPPT